ncbi:MAG TPA: NUDIX domain-containing protein [Arachnia sp.]|nr:NUDIX domain-containing protein [Arachnia sp.]
MSDFKVEVEVSGGVGKLRWAEQTVDLETLQRAVSLAADDAIIAHDLRRLQVELPEWDTAARTALHRAGFRLEGRLRSAIEPEKGVYRDILVYARLAVDPVYGPHGFSGVLDSILPKKRLIGHVLFRDEDGRVLLLETTYKEDWELPGGVVEPGETPRAAAEREVAEEVGLVVELGQPLLTDWMPPHLGWSDAVELIFDGGVLDLATAAALTAHDREIREVHWVAPDDVPAHVSELSARRIALLLTGYRGYTEAGYPVA